MSITMNAPSFTTTSFNVTKAKPADSLTCMVATASLRNAIYTTMQETPESVADWTPHFDQYKHVWPMVHDFKAAFHDALAVVCATK